MKFETIYRGKYLRGNGLGGTKICHFFIVSDSETVEAKVWKEVKRRLLALVEYSGTIGVRDCPNLTSILLIKKGIEHY